MKQTPTPAVQEPSATGSDVDAEGSLDEELGAQQTVPPAHKKKIRKRKPRRKMAKQREDAESDEWNGNASDVTHEEYSDFDLDFPVRVSSLQLPPSFFGQGEEMEVDNERPQYTRIYDVNVTIPKTQVCILLFLLR